MVIYTKRKTYNTLGSYIIKIKRESGENPERSGHCNWGVIL